MDNVGLSTACTALLSVASTLVVTILVFHIGISARLARVETKVDLALGMKRTP